MSLVWTVLIWLYFFLLLAQLTFPNAQFAVTNIISMFACFEFFERNFFLRAVPMAVGLVSMSSFAWMVGWITSRLVALVNNILTGCVHVPCNLIKFFCFDFTPKQQH